TRKRTCSQTRLETKNNRTRCTRNAKSTTNTARSSSSRPQATRRQQVACLEPQKRDDTRWVLDDVSRTTDENKKRVSLERNKPAIALTKGDTSSRRRRCHDNKNAKQRQSPPIHLQPTIYSQRHRLLTERLVPPLQQGVCVGVLMFCL
ncbi:unnamed protein product, partial [Ectocarpus sp. 12 AP-2014]